MKSVVGLVLSALLVIVSGCAVGPSLKDSARAVSTLESGKARIVFYRTIIIGAAYQPDVLLNGQKVGNAVPRGAFFRDVPPGRYSVTTTMTSEVVTFDIAVGEKKYVKLNYGFGFRIYPELMDSAIGEAESSDISNTGPI